MTSHGGTAVAQPMTDTGATIDSAIAMLFDARSVAVIGASGDPTKLSSMPVLAMEKMGFAGGLTGVNPKYQRVGRWACVPSIDDLPAGVEAAIILLPAVPAVAAAQALVARGVRSLVIVGQGFGESGDEGLALGDELIRLARSHGVAICGPNTNGLANVRTGLGLSFAPALLSDQKIRQGSVGIISQSGAVISAILSKTTPRGVGISKFVSCGNELLLSMSDYLRHFARDPETDAILLYIEAIRDPAGLRAALADCRAAGKRVVALKAGASDGGQKAALSHTGAIAGSYRNIVTFLESEGVAVVDDLDAIAALIELTVRFPRRDGPALRTGLISVSGGYAALAADCMARLGLPLEDLSDRAKAELRALPIQSHQHNPYDTAAQHALMDKVFDIFKRDGFEQIMVGMTPLAAPVRQIMLPILVRARQLFAELHVFAPGLPADEMQVLQAAGISVAESFLPQMQALRSLRRLALRAAPKAAVTLAPPPALPPGERMLDEAESKAVLSALGLQVPKGAVVETGATVPADLVGPLAVKALTTRIAHKSDFGLVALNVARPDLPEVCARLAVAARAADSASSGLLVEEMLSEGIEAFIGLTRDPVAGPLVVIGAGGLLLELLDDTVVLMPPFDGATVHRALDGTRLGAVLGGYRGRRWDVDAFVAAVLTIGELALSAPRIEGLDINPMLVRPSGQGSVALDAKIFLRDAVLL